MIRVTPQPEPDDFDKKVRKKGLQYLAKRALNIDEPLPKGAQIAPYWRDCMTELYHAYSGICAYLAVHFERTTRGGTVEHYAPKSHRVELAYEWNNYRLASSIMNARKNNFEDVLDPFEITTGWFHVELVSGRIYPDPELAGQLQKQVGQTITRLGLDDRNNREMRARHFQEYCEKLYPEEYLKRRSPLVWVEANRQGLLGTEG